MFERIPMVSNEIVTLGVRGARRMPGIFSRCVLRMTRVTQIPGRRIRKRITDPAPACMTSEVAAHDKRQPGGPECRRNRVVSCRSETTAVQACA
jgi:hypothetical protein